MAAARSDSAAIAGAPGVLHEAILQTLASAVISMRPDGVIITFNAAAAGITGLTPESVIGRTFAEVFVPMEGAEDFTQAVLDSVYQGPLVRRRLIEAAFDAGIRSLSVSVSRIVAGEDDDAGLAVVFDDISKIRELREKEVALAREVDAQHRELREAYLGLEESNRTLAEANRQARLARVGGLGAVVVLLTVLGLYAMDFRSPGPNATERASETAGWDSVVMTVEPRELSKSVLVEGRLAPRREVDVTSPMTGKVAVVHVPYGARVEQGQLLLELDVTEVRIEHRDAEAGHIRALERFNETDNWADGVEVSRARRSVAKARLDLADSSTKVEETAFLLGRGVIPSSEHDAAQRSFNNRRLDLEAAEQDLASVLKKGTADARVARLELANAKARLDELSETLRLAMLRAPVGGVVMRPAPTEGGGESRERLGAGDSVTQGERLLIIGDLDGVSVVGRVDEVDVVEIEPGNEVLIRGDAFRDTVLRGIVERVSSEAIIESRALPFFEVTAVVESLTPDQRAALRIGMSAVLEVLVRREASAVLVPLDAVTLADGQPTVLVARGDDFRPVPVSVGESTIDSVEILEGVVPGDRILVPQP
ncbi:MAG: efflux RND transporter periplasmic adaptor subunit [Gammaproteobacteria bacterium]|nr:efflux RND transporter periplasmic adaptor subunit [Gammaproteobacteria bacterium]